MTILAFVMLALAISMDDIEVFSFYVMFKDFMDD